MIFPHYIDTLTKLRVVLKEEGRHSLLDLSWFGLLCLLLLLLGGLGGDRLDPRILRADDLLRHGELARLLGLSHCCSWLFFDTLSSWREMVGLLLSPFCTVFLSPLVYNPTCLLKWLKKPGICPKKPGKFSLITCCGPGIFHGAFIVIFTSGNDGAFTVAAGWLVDDDGLIHARMNRWMDDDGSGGGNTIGAAFLGAVAGRSTVPLDVSGYGLRRLWLEWNRRRTIRARVAMGARPCPRPADCGAGRHWVSLAVQVKIWGNARLSSHNTPD